jgi:hypothetical protein
MLKKVLIAISLVLIVAVAATALFHLKMRQPASAVQKYSLQSTVADALVKANQNFAAAEQYRAQNNYSAAIRAGDRGIQASRRGSVSGQHHTGIRRSRARCHV